MDYIGCDKPSPLQIRDYYAQEGLMEFMFKVAKHREFVPVYDGKYGKRPDALNMPGDLKAMILNGATSFHMSVERWQDPLKLSNEMKQQEIEELRTGWDIVLDIDCNEGYVYAREAAVLLSKAIRAHGVKNVFVKFSGSRGFHVAVPFESIPKEVNGVPTSSLYPALLQDIARYLKHLIKEKLGEVLVKKYPELYEKIAEKDESLNPYRIMEIEENWSVRHLFRAPYSLNEKTWLVSLPLMVEELSKFEPEMARMENVRVGRAGFLTSWEENEAEDLVFEAMEYAERSSYRRTGSIISTTYESDASLQGMREVRTDTYLKSRMDEKFFPPCIKKGLEGLEDGRKRFLFVLINFLKLMRWKPEEIEQVVWDWNKRNREPLRDSYVRSQLKYAFKKQMAYIPPNCDNRDYYPDIKICEKDSLCEKIRNPLSYTLSRYALYLRHSKRKRGNKRRNERHVRGDKTG